MSTNLEICRGRGVFVRVWRAREATGTRQVTRHCADHRTCPACACRLSLMPGRDAKFGDVYWVSATATKHPVRVGKTTRPLACMAERRGDTVWTGLPRSTTGTKPEDHRDSPPMPEIGLDKPGWWSARYVHPVYKDRTGEPGVCDYLGPLPTDQLKVAREVFRNRLFDE